MFVDYSKVKKEVKGTKVNKPISGTLSGHAAGEPFDKHVYDIIKKQFPENTYRQFEFLNKLYIGNPSSRTYEERIELFNSKSAAYLLRRGKAVTQQWSKSNLFEEKQNDTADILVHKDSKYEIIDIKTRNLSKPSQPPNIISAKKVAELMKIIIDNDEYDILDINYFAIDWKLEGGYLICEDSYFASLFKENPKSLYINWAAAMQIQFHVSDLKQDYEFSLKRWAKEYLEHFVESAKGRARKMENDFVNPYLSYIE